MDSQRKASAPTAIRNDGNNVFQNMQNFEDTSQS